MQSKFKSNKSEVRSDLLQQLNQISSQQRYGWSQLIQNSLSRMLVNETGFWGAYQNLSNEPEINWAEVSNQIQWCFPQVQENQLNFKTKAKSFCRSSLGVQEPVDGEVVALDGLQGVIAPGVGFSKSGHRLGRGKGFYDRSLSLFNGKKIAVCFGLSFIEEIPYEAHDVLFNHIVTERSIYQVDDPEGDLKWN